MIDKHFIINAHGYRYRVVPNPDGEPGSGFSQGATIEYQDDGSDKWCNQLFVGPDEIAQLAEALTEAAKDVNP